MFDSFDLFSSFWSLYMKCMSCLGPCWREGCWPARTRHPPPLPSLLPRTLHICFSPHRISFSLDGDAREIHHRRHHHQHHCQRGLPHHPQAVHQHYLVKRKKEEEEVEDVEKLWMEFHFQLRPNSCLRQIHTLDPPR